MQTVLSLLKTDRNGTNPLTIYESMTALFRVPRRRIDHQKRSVFTFDADDAFNRAAPLNSIIKHYMLVAFPLIIITICCSLTLAEHPSDRWMHCTMCIRLFSPQMANDVMPLSQSAKHMLEGGRSEVCTNNATAPPNESTQGRSEQYIGTVPKTTFGKSFIVVNKYRKHLKTYRKGTDSEKQQQQLSLHRSSNTELPTMRY